MADFYSILGVNKNASEDEIKKAYRKAAVKWHPDRWSGKSESEQKHAEEMFKQIAEANDVLSDPDKRSRYDKFGDNWDKFGSGPDIDIFSHFSRGGFGDFFGFGNHSENRGPENGADMLAKISIDIHDIFNGDTRELDIKVEQRCKECNGKGGEVETCPHCHGKGQIVKSQRFGSQFIQQIMDCPHCGGTGKIYKTKCTKCHGEGVTYTTKRIKVHIPAGVRNGQDIVFTGVGNESRDPHGNNGNIIVRCIYNLDPQKYVIQGNTVYEKLNIPYYDAIIGCEKTVTLPNGKQHNIIVKPYSKDGDNITLYGKGINNGNYVFVISIDLPSHISNEETELLKQIQNLH